MYARAQPPQRGAQLDIRSNFTKTQGARLCDHTSQHVNHHRQLSNRTQELLQVDSPGQADSKQIAYLIGQSEPIKAITRLWRSEVSLGTVHRSQSRSMFLARYESFNLFQSSASFTDSLAWLCRACRRAQPRLHVRLVSNLAVRLDLGNNKDKRTSRPKDRPFHSSSFLFSKKTLRIHLTIRITSILRSFEQQTCASSSSQLFSPAWLSRNQPSQWLVKESHNLLKSMPGISSNSV